MPARIESTLTIELAPEKATADLRLDDFLEELDAFRVALRETERLVSAGRDPALYFTIKRLQKKSPALVELEAASSADDDRSKPRFAGYVVRSLTTNLRVIGTGKRPRRIDVPTLSAYEDITIPLAKHGLEVVVKYGSNAVRIDQRFRDAMRAVMGDDEISYGSVSGRIEAMTTHSRNMFRLYPVVGATRIIGSFSVKNRSKFVAGMDKYVTVWGKLKYKSWDRFPYAVDAVDIDIHDGAPASLLDLKGIAPDATAAMTTQQFLDELRDE